MGRRSAHAPLDSSKISNLRPNLSLDFKSRFAKEEKKRTILVKKLIFTKKKSAKRLTTKMAGLLVNANRHAHQFHPQFPSIKELFAQVAWKDR